MSSGMFSMDDFMCVKSLEYLKYHFLDRKALTQLLNIISQLNFSCAKYLIKKCPSFELYEDYAHNNCMFAPIYFVCKYGKLPIIKYVLKSCAEDLDKQIDPTYDFCPIHLLCDRTEYLIIKFVLNFWIEHDLDLESNVHMSGLKPIHFLCSSIHDKRTFCYILNFWTTHNLDLECDDDEYWKPIHCICKFGNDMMIRTALDFWMANNLDLDCTNDFQNTPFDILAEVNTTQNTMLFYALSLEKSVYE